LYGGRWDRVQECQGEVYALTSVDSIVPVPWFVCLHHAGWMSKRVGSIRIRDGSQWDQSDFTSPVTVLVEDLQEPRHPEQAMCTFLIEGYVGLRNQGSTDKIALAHGLQIGKGHHAFSLTGRSSCSKSVCGFLSQLRLDQTDSEAGEAQPSTR